MRKVKHYAGYGTVSMGKIDDGTARLHVRVEGNHECGIHYHAWDLYGLWDWIVRRFMKGMTYEEWHRLRPVVEIVDNFRDRPGEGYVDICDYYFHF